MQLSECPPGDPLRGAIIGAVEERTGQTVSASSPLPDDLIAKVQTLQPLGCGLGTLEIWIRFCEHPNGVTAPAFEEWFRAAIAQAARPL